MLAIGTWMQGFMISEIGLNEIILPQIIRGLISTANILTTSIIIIRRPDENKIKNASGYIL